jgi:hypothetical protein
VDRWSFWWVAEGVRPCNGIVEWRLLWWFVRRFGLAKRAILRVSLWVSKSD